MGFHGGKFYPYETGYWAYGEQIANYWKAIGISVDTILLDRPAWWANRQAGKMKGATFIDSLTHPTVAGRLSYLFFTGSYGIYPDLQALWERYEQELAAEPRKELLGQMQTLIRDRAIYLPINDAKSVCAFGPNVKGNPFRIQPLMWVTVPFENMELVK